MYYDYYTCATSRAAKNDLVCVLLAEVVSGQAMEIDRIREQVSCFYSLLSVVGAQRGTSGRITYHNLLCDRSSKEA